MKSLYKTVFALLGFAYLLMIGCTNSAPSNKLTLSNDDSATGITFSWYVPDSILQDLIGPYYSPQIVNDKDEGLLMFSVTNGNNHRIDGENAGNLAMAQLFVPVIRMSGLKADPDYKIENVIVSPLTILAESKPYYTKLNKLGFSVVKGKIDFSLKEEEDKIIIESTITTTAGETFLNATFENLPVDTKSVTAIINPGSKRLKYFYGKESAQRYENGKGFVKSEGNTFYSGLNLRIRPFIITLDREFVTDFNFEEN